MIVDNVAPRETLQGSLVLSPRSNRPVPIREFQFFVDGIYQAGFRPNEVIQCDTAQLSDGHHELRLVAVESSPIETQGRVILPVIVDNQGQTVDWRIKSRVIDRDASAKLYVSSPGAKSIVLLHHRRQLGRINRDKGHFSINSRAIGLGPVTLTAVAIDSSSGNAIFSEPIQLMIRD